MKLNFRDIVLEGRIDQHKRSRLIRYSGHIYGNYFFNKSFFLIYKQNFKAPKQVDESYGLRLSETNFFLTLPLAELISLTLAGPCKNHVGWNIMTHFHIF